VFLILDIIVFIKLKSWIAPDAKSAIAGTIHFATSYILRSVWMVLLPFIMLWFGAIYFLLIYIGWKLLSSLFGDWFDGLF